MPTRLETIRQRLDAHGQSHLLGLAESLGPAQIAGLLDQVESLDLDQIDKLIALYVRAKPDAGLPADLTPAKCYMNDPTTPGSSYDASLFRGAGEELVRAGKVAAFTVAGGQGTRLGWNGPKGSFPATPVEGKPLFRVFAEQILAVERKYRVSIPWYIMTSPVNDTATRAFFADNNSFGLDRGNILMFPQGMMPSFDAATGAMLLARPDELAMSPDGHGGSLRALRASGALDDMAARGISVISYFQVDNPLVNIVDPLFIGLHAVAPDSSGEMSSKMLPKIASGEKVGVFCQSGGKTMVVEYSDLPEALANERSEGGSLRFIAGSIAIHLLGVEFVQNLTAGEFALPWHRADKKVPHVDPDTGEQVEPEVTNGVKLETFVFDAIPLAQSSIVYETVRQQEFGPIKNASGVDSAQSSQQLQSDRFGAWLEANGVVVERDGDGRVMARIEISPLTAQSPDDLEGMSLPERAAVGDRVSL